MDERPDEVLVVEARKGHREAFSALVGRYQGRIYPLIYRMTQNHSDTDDLLQEVFLTAYRSLPAFRGRSRFYTWIYRIAVNLTLNFLKKRAREKDRAEFHENIPHRGNARGEILSPERRSIQMEMERHLEEAIDALPPLFKTSFLLVVNHEMSHAEAARILGCTVNTVSWRIHKARRLLRDRLKPFWME